MVTNVQEVVQGRRARKFKLSLWPT